MPRPRAAAVAAALVLVACDRGQARLPWVEPGRPELRELQSLGHLDAPALAEGSGVVPSDRTPGVLWALNDSGNDPDLFALAPSGQVRGVVRVTGARNRDWEALAHGPCPVGTCLFIGDVGDNGGRREAVDVYWLAEPPVPNGTASAPVAGVLRVRFADGPHDVEAIYVAPDTSLWFVSKRPATGPDGAPRPAHVHRLPASAWADSAPLPVVDSLPVVPRRGDERDWITDASLSSADSTGERRLALLTYGAVYVFATDRRSGRPGALLARCALPIRERTAEGITWLADGRLFVLPEGVGATVHAGKCP